MNDCKGCKYENSTDMETFLEFCAECKRAYSIKKIENFKKISIEL